MDFISGVINRSKIPNIRKQQALQSTQRNIQLAEVEYANKEQLSIISTCFNEAAMSMISSDPSYEESTHYSNCIYKLLELHQYLSGYAYDASVNALANEFAQFKSAKLV